MLNDVLMLYIIYLYY